MEEQKHLFKNPNHLANLNSMRLSGQLCDVTIKVNNKEFPAHRNILAANLEYFQSMFLKTFKESKQDVIVMKDVDESDLEVFISFAYTGEILLTDKNALGLLKVANYLNEDVIKEACIDFLGKHLKVEDACQAYQLANDIGCPLLENTAKQTISLHFEKCSQTMEYRDFDYEALKKILHIVNQTSESRNVFEGIMRWILHDVSNRKSCINNLLNLMDVTKMAPGYLMNYFCEVLKDQSDIAKQIMFFYHEKMKEVKTSKQSLMAIGIVDNKLQEKFYNFSEKTWCCLCEIMNFNKDDDIDTWTVSNNKFYFTVYKYENSELCLHVFDASKKRTTILSSEKELLRSSAMCASSEMLYFCGGQLKGRLSPSNQILGYDLQVNTFKTLPSMSQGRGSAAAIFYQDCLLVLGGWDNLDGLNVVEKYDPNTKSWKKFPSMTKARSNFGVAILNNKLYASGGSNDFDSSNTVEVYDPTAESWRQVASMNKPRREFFLVAHEEKLFAIGGDEDNTVEVYDPNKDQWQIDHQMSSGLQRQCFGGGLISSSYAD